MPRKRRHRKVDATGRNVGEGQWFKVPYAVARHPAFQSLSGPAVKVWIELHLGYNGGNNGKVSLSFQRAATLLYLSKSTVARAFRELANKGFIKLRKPGQWYGRLAAEWILTDKGYDGMPPTQDWERWKPPPGKEKQKSVPIRRRWKAKEAPECVGPNFPEPAWDQAGTRRADSG